MEACGMSIKLKALIIRVMAIIIAMADDDDFEDF